MRTLYFVETKESGAITIASDNGKIRRILRLAYYPTEEPKEYLENVNYNMAEGYYNPMFENIDSNKNWETYEETIEELFGDPDECEIIAELSVNW